LIVEMVAKPPNNQTIQQSIQIFLKKELGS